MQSVEAVERAARRIPDARVIVLPGDSFHIAAVEPDLCAQHALQFIDEISARQARATFGCPPLQRSRGPGDDRACCSPDAPRRAGSRAVAGLRSRLRRRRCARKPYPVRPVRIVVPFAPGGGADLIARLIAPQLQQHLEQSFFIDNRAGAAGRIGAGAVAKSEPDGHTLLMTTESSIVIAPHIGVPMSYDPLKDFAPVSLLTRNRDRPRRAIRRCRPAALRTTWRSPARDRAQLFYASSGAGGPNHLAGEIFKQMTGLTIVHVPYQGTGAAIPAVISNQVGAMWGFMAGTAAAYPQRHPARRSRSAPRSARPALPEVPTVAEAGVPGYEASSWIGLLAPAGTPAADHRQAVGRRRTPPCRNRRCGRSCCATARTSSSAGPSEFRRVIEEDDAKYAKLRPVLGTKCVSAVTRAAVKWQLRSYAPSQPRQVCRSHGFQ